jgi:hypothetical protein
LLTNGGDFRGTSAFLTGVFGTPPVPPDPPISFSENHQEK